MVRALIQLSNNANRVLNIVKATYNLRDKAEAIEFVVGEYIEQKNEPELRPEFIKKMEKIMKQKTIRIGSLKDFKRRYGL